MEETSTNKRVPAAPLLSPLFSLRRKPARSERQLENSPQHSLSSTRPPEQKKFLSLSAVPPFFSAPSLFSDPREKDHGEDEGKERYGHDEVGLEPHEKAAAYEAQERFAQALRWHRKDLEAARARALDGEEEDERESAVDLARALRNTGRCLGMLGNSGFAEVSRRRRRGYPRPAAESPHGVAE